MAEGALKDACTCSRPCAITTPPHGRGIGTAMAFRSYYVLRRILPRRWLFRHLLEVSGIVRRLTLEQTWYTWSPTEALRRCRPHSLPFVIAAVPADATVIDLGGGSGVVSHALAAHARRVVYVDADPRSVASAADLCGRDGNVVLVCGDMLQVVADRGPFDVGILLHLLGAFPDTEAVLRHLARHCRRLVVEVPNFDHDPFNAQRQLERLPFHTDARYVREFDLSSLMRCLGEGGWLVREARAAGDVVLAVADQR